VGIVFELFSVSHRPIGPVVEFRIRSTALAQRPMGFVFRIVSVFGLFSLICASSNNKCPQCPPCRATNNNTSETLDREMPRFLVIPEVFTPSECSKIISTAMKLSLRRFLTFIVRTHLFLATLLDSTLDVRAGTGSAEDISGTVRTNTQIRRVPNTNPLTSHM